MGASDWSAVDAAADPGRLLSGLDALRVEPFFARSKSRLAAVLSDPHLLTILDVGCGTGDDAADLAAADHTAIGLEASTVMAREARRRYGSLPLVAGDAATLPIREAAVDAVRADRVIQHLPDGAAALREWRRVIRPGGSLVTFDPDLTTAEVSGVDSSTAAVILGWRLRTRPGARTVSGLPEALAAAGFDDVHIETPMLDLTDLDRADGIMGLADWGGAAADAQLLTPDEAGHWRDDVHAAWHRGQLSYRCTYVLARGRAG